MFSKMIKIILGLILVSAEVYAQASAPVISNSFPTSAYVGQSFTHTPVVEDADANYVAVSNYQASTIAGPIPGTQYRVNTHSYSNQHEAAFVQLNDGAYVIAWQSLGQDGSDYGVYAQLYTQDGQVIGGEFPLHSIELGDQKSLALAPHNDGGFVAVWETENLDGSGRAIAVRRFTIDGTPVSVEVLVNTGTAGDQTAPDIIQLSDSSYRVVWQSDSDDGTGTNIIVRTLLSDATPTGGEWAVNTYRADDQDRPKIAAMSNDNLVITWQSFSQDGSGYGVYHRRFQSDGTALDASDVLINNAQQYNSQSLGNIAVLTNDSYVVTYTSIYQGADQSVDGVFQSVYDASGNIISGDVLVNTYTQDYQKSSNVAALAGGGYIIAWNSYPQDSSGYGVYFQQYDNSGAAIGTETLAAELISGDQRYPLIGALYDGGFVVVFRSEWTAWDEYWGVHARNFSLAENPPTEIQHTELSWSPSLQPLNSEQIFQYRKIEENSWNVAQADLIDGFYRVAFEGLADGNYIYQINYSENDVLVKQISYGFSVGGESMSYADALYFELILAPAGMSINSATGVVTWTPTVEQLGNHDISFVVWDNSELSDTQTATITVAGLANTAPTITSDPVVQATVGEQYAYAVIAIDQETENLAYRLIEAPVEMSIDLSTGLITWLPNAGNLGLNAVSVVVTDEGGLSAQQNYQILVEQINTAPIITSEPVAGANRGDLYTYDVDAIDPDLLDTMTFILIEAPLGMTIDANTGEIHWDTSNAALDYHPVSVLVFDSAEAYDQQNFTVEIEAASPNNPPEIVRAKVCEFEQLNWLEISGGFSVSDDGRTLIESTSQSANAIAALDLGLDNQAYWEIQVEGMDSLASLGWGIIRDTETVLNPASNLTWGHLNSIVAHSTSSSVSDYGPGGNALYSGTQAEAAFKLGDVLMVAWDQGRLYFGTNGVWWNNADPANGMGFVAEGLAGYRPFLSHDNTGGSSRYTVNSKSTDLVYDVPFICPTANLFTDVGDDYIYDVDAVDLDGDALVYELTEYPEGMSIESDSGLIQWMSGVGDVGPHAINIRVRDGRGGEDNYPFTLTVAEYINNPPEIVDAKPCESEQLTWLEISGSFSVSEDGRTFNESTTQSGNAIAALDLGLNNSAYWEIKVEAMDLLSSLGWGVIRDTETVLNPAYNLTWDHRKTIVARSTNSWVADYGQGGNSLYSGTQAEAAFKIGDVLMVAWDKGRLYFGTNGVWWNNADPANGIGFVAEGIAGYRPYISHNNIGGSSQYTVNSKSADLVYEAPYFCPAANLSVNVQEDYVFDVDAVDLDGDSLIYELTEYPDGMSIDRESGLIQWLPDGGDEGAHAINIRVRDGRGGEDNYAFTLTVEVFINSPPVIVSFPETKVRNPEYHYFVRVEDLNFGEVHTYYLDAAPAGMTIDSSSGVILWEPTTLQVGDHSVAIRVSDNGGLEAEQSYTLSYVIDPTAPTIISDPVVVTEEAQLYQYDVDAIDPNPAEVLTYSLHQSPATMTINPDTGLINWYAYSPEGLTEISFDELEEAAHINDQYPGIHFKAYDIDGSPKPIYAEFFDNTIYPESEKMYLAPRVYQSEPVYTWEINFDSLVDYLYIRVLDAEEPLTIELYRGEVKVGHLPQPTSDNAGYDFSVGKAGGPLLFDRIVFLVDVGGPELFDNLRYHTPAMATVEVRATNSLGKFDEQRFDIHFTPSNYAPVFTSSPMLGGIVNSQYSYQLVTTDYNADLVDYTLVSAPVGMQVDENGLITWSPTLADLGQHLVRINASDGAGGETVQEYLLTVRDVDSSAVFTSMPPLVAYPNVQYAYKARAYDPEGDEVHFYLLQAPSGMSVNLLDGQVLWTPSALDVGNYDISLEARGRFGGQSSLQNFVIQVIGGNQAPQITSEAITSVYADSEYYYQVTAIDADETTALSYQLLSAPTTMAIDEVSGEITWLPTLSESGQHTIQVQVSDSEGLIDGQDFDLVVQAGNASPLITSTAPNYAVVNTSYVYAVIATDANMNDVLSYSLENGPVDMDVDALSGMLSWTPDSADIGAHAISVRVTDPQGAYSEQYFTINVQNSDMESPVVGLSVNPANPTVGQTVSIQVNALDNVAIASVTLEVNGLAVALDSNNFATYVPAVTGIHTIVATAEDTSSNSTSLSVEISAVALVNNPPSITSEAITSARTELLYRYDVDASDADGDVLTYTLQTAPSGMTIEATTGEILWTPTEEQVGPSSVVVRVSDGDLYQDQSWQTNVYDSAIPLIAELSVSSSFVDPGELLTIGLYVEGAVGSVTREVTVDGVPIAIDESGLGSIASNIVGPHVIQATVTDLYDSATDELIFFVRDANDTIPPEVTLTSPGNDSEIAAIAEVIGSVSDANLAIWQLALIRKDSNLQTILAQGGEGFTSSVIANIEAFALVNGLYSVVLQATDMGGNTVSESRSVLVSGDLKVGNFSFTIRDLTIPLAGIPIEVNRTYDSRRRHELLDFGYGWSIDYQNVLVGESRIPGAGWARNEYSTGPLGILTNFCIEPLGAPTVTVTLPNGSVERFEVAASPQCMLSIAVFDVDLIFNAVGDTQSTLSAADAGGGRLVGDHIEILGDGFPIDPDHYILTTRAGYIYHLDQNFGIELVEDPNGHTLTYSDAGIVHSSGKSVDFVRNAEGQIINVVDPDGNFLTYTRDAAENLIGVTERDLANSRYTYNANHGLIDIIDPLNRRVMRNIYDDKGLLTGQEDGDGNVKIFSHDINARSSLITDLDGRSKLFNYDDRGNVTEEITLITDGSYASDILTEYSYDANGNQETKTIGASTWTTLRNEKNDVLESRNPELESVFYSDYNSRGQEGTITDERGHVFRLAYDVVGNRLSVESPEVTDPDTGAVSQKIAGSFINAQGLVDSTTDFRGLTTTFTYYPSAHVNAGQKESESNPVSGTIIYSYDVNNNVTTETRERTVGSNVITESTSYSYDERDRLTRTTYDNGAYDETVYELAGNPDRERDRFGNWTDYTYDLYGRLVETVYADGAVETNTYTLEGLSETHSDRLGRVTRHEYDDAGLLRYVHSEADGTYTETRYNEKGWVIAEYDALRNLTEYEYDLAGRRTAVVRHIDGAAQRHAFSYYPNGELQSETDALNRTTTYILNELDQRIEVQHHNGTVTQDRFDFMGARTHTIDQETRSTVFGYDDLGRLASVTPEISIDGVPVPATVYSYDERGNRKTQMDAELKTTTWTYDLFGRVLTRQLPEGMFESFVYTDGQGCQSDAGINCVMATSPRSVVRTDFIGDTITTAFDVMGRAISVVYSKDGNSEIYAYYVNGQIHTVTDQHGATEYFYDSRDRLETETRPDGSQMDYSYDDAGNRISVSVTRNAVVTSATTYTYDDLNRLETATDGSGTTDYDYDAVGNLEFVTYANGLQTEYVYNTINRLTDVYTRDPLTTVISHFNYTLTPTGRREVITELDGRTTTYTYDDLYRLTSEAITDTSNGDYSATYEYDMVGNRTYETVDGVSAAYTYDFNDRLMQTGGTEYTYDHNGNTLTETLDAAVKTYTWDGKNKLVSLNNSGVTSSYTYNHNDIRTSKTEGGVTTKFIVDENTTYAQVLEEVVNDNAIVTYSYGHDLINQNRAGSFSYYHYDGLGSTRALSDDVGTLTDEYNYASFGELLNQTGATDNTYLFTGEQYDASLGQYYLRARYYDQGIGRFTQMDTWSGVNRQPITLNKYLYANSDPALYSDPSGNLSLISISVSINIRGILSTASFPKVIGSIISINSGALTVAALSPFLIGFFERGVFFRKIAIEYYSAGLADMGDAYMDLSRINFSAFSGSMNAANTSADLVSAVTSLTKGMLAIIKDPKKFFPVNLKAILKFNSLNNSKNKIIKSVNNLNGAPPEDDKTLVESLMSAMEKQALKFLAEVLK